MWWMSGGSIAPEAETEASATDLAVPTGQLPCCRSRHCTRYEDELAECGLRGRIVALLLALDTVTPTPMLIDTAMAMVLLRAFLF